MKKLLLFALTVLGGLAVNAQGTWVSQATGFADVSSGVRYVSAVDTNVVWICSYDGSGGGASRTDFSRTTDGGNTWTAGQTGAPSTYDWSMIFGLDANTAWAVYYDAVAGAGGGIYKTSDGGATWSQQGAGSIYAGAASFPNVVHFWDANNGFSMGDPLGGYYEIYTTADGGNTWVRVPQASIPAPTSGEYGIVGHYEVVGDTVWFDTNKGRVYRSVDRGLTWTVASTGITVPANGAIDICFYSATNGLARLYNATTGGNSMRITSNGGTTWSAVTPVGSFFGSDVQHIPGTASTLISTGAATGFVGTSFSYNGGINWTTVETAAQRTALGCVDSLHMWTGGFTTSPTSDGIFKWTVVPTVQCGDASISPGTTSATATQLCAGDTSVFTSTGVFAPTVGDFSGVSWVISTVDLTGTTTLPTFPTLVATYTFTYPAPSSSSRFFVNDGTLVDGTNVPYGTYYWTPVVFANATAASNPPVFLSDLVLDPACLYIGTSVAVSVLDPLDPACTGVGLAENSLLNGMTAAQDGQNVNIRFNTERNGIAVMEVFDMSGRKVYGQNLPVQGGLNFIQIDASTFAAGTYMVKAQVNGTAAQTKIVKL